MRSIVSWLLFALSLNAYIANAGSAYRSGFPERKLLFDGTYGPPAWNQFSLPGPGMNPAVYQTPFLPRLGQSSMLPAPPAIFHDGALPVMSIYELHHPEAYTPNSPYGLPHIYNPFHAMNMPYNFLHHPFAPQLITQMSMQSLAADPYAGTPLTTAHQINPGVANSNFRIAPVNPLGAGTPPGRKL